MNRSTVLCDSRRLRREVMSRKSLTCECLRLFTPYALWCKGLFYSLPFPVHYNTDDHNKNFSFIMNEDGTWRLSPAYDITYIIDLGGFLPNEDHCIIV